VAGNGESRTKRAGERCSEQGNGSYRDQQAVRNKALAMAGCDGLCLLLRRQKSKVLRFKTILGKKLVRPPLQQTGRYGGTHL
jgi:hypothetical protein